MRKYTVEPFFELGSETVPATPGWSVKLGNDTICEVFCGHNGSGLTGGLYGAERIAAALNAIEGISAVSLEPPYKTATGGYSLLTLRETLRDMVQQFKDNDTEGLEESMALVEMNISILDGNG